MNLRDRIKELANQRKISVAELERALGFGNGSISKWNKQSPSTEKLKQVADYFQVSLDYLVGRSDDKYDLSPQEKIDIGIEAEKMMKGLNDEGSINFYGEPMSEEDKEATLSALNLLMTINRKKAKKKKDMN
ncbi:helix-turn-helix transcriptional regulator [Ligilactobacillus salivarius]|uniref:Helix-turn-helix transcriptional regulator n=1 Tax=Ligilactobacillus salivarius TaxID=1624 RepID=A0ABD7YUE7_9LACO|nr:helix-turn-helix transcriptional regulator [Ligilactobacillus salivarius]WHS06267.1 helix-turn-helix transcriptional regulator [Ligilactobacillus salivarius]WHS07650.1 helix-turn-helix transcriptional regulator [Ligilactobacillus salivarius]WHS10186.1 helix-turn-helix transcriptional regulator [Ligilactobacillus salivarius]WHS14123.1 helix-turn-helix transcriptional regulator [Ligilactobacillus salivarius]WHS17261.1 helix-turn-helix transcriptional regulator [Ligilactobacillus salivarius]